MAVSPLHWAARLLRLGVLGGVSLLLAAGAHLAGGGALPAPGVLAVVAALLSLMALVVTQRRCRFPVLGMLLGAQQTALHALFTAATVPATDCPGLASVGHHGTVAVSAGCTPLTGTATMTMSGPGMWLAHAVAVVVTAWLLSRGEAWLWRAAERFIRSATAAPTSLRSGGAAVRAGTLLLATYGSCLTSPAAPRGPPLRVAV